MAALWLVAAGAQAAPAAAEPDRCDNAGCLPGVGRGAVEGAHCDETAHYVFNIIADGRYVFCGTPRMLPPRWFLAPPIRGIKNEGEPCAVNQYGDAAQAPDGLFLSCVVDGAKMFWTRGDT